MIHPVRNRPLRGTIFVLLVLAGGSATAQPLQESTLAEALPTTTTAALPDLALLDIARAPRESTHPRVLAVVTFDHFRADYLTRFADQFTTGGFARLMRDGYWARDCRYLHAVTTSAAGHSILATGADPNHTGIIGDAWFDPTLKRLVGSVEDPSERLLAGRGIRADRAGASPRRLAVPTIGDLLHAATAGRAQVIALSMTEHAAILFGGASADCVLWWDGATNQFVTSSYYAQQLEPWVVLFNDQLRVRNYAGVEWTLLRPESWYARSGRDEEPYESASLGRTFPHPVVSSDPTARGNPYQRLVATPLGDDLLLELADKAIGAERLGADEVPDLLFLSFGSNAFISRAYGPYSRETHDLMLRTDQLVVRLLALLDRRFGDSYTLVVAGSGGVAPVPESLRALRVSAGRISPGTLMESAERHLRARFPSDLQADRHPFLAAFASSWIWLDESSLRARRLDPRDVRTALRDFLRQQQGIATAFTSDELAEGRFRAADPAAVALALDLFPGRSGDVVVLSRPYWIISPASEGTASGTPYPYDQHVGLLAYGKGIAGGHEVFDRLTPEGLAPTLATLLGIEVPPGSEGRVYPGALVDGPPPIRP